MSGLGCERRDLHVVCMLLSGYMCECLCFKWLQAQLKLRTHETIKLRSVKVYIDAHIDAHEFHVVSRVVK